MDERGRLKRMITVFAAELRACHPTELVVHERHETLESFGVAPTPVDQKVRDVVPMRHDSSNDCLVQISL